MSIAHSNVIELRIKRVWRAMGPNLERRESRRFGPSVVSARLAIVDSGGTNLSLTPCTLLNVSFGGMCFSTSCDVRENSECRFLIEFTGPIADFVILKARTVWCRCADSMYREAGVEFLESSKGWLGPE